MVDFGKSVKAAEREAKAKKTVAQNTKPVAPYGFKKDGTPRKRPATSAGRWKKGESGNPDKIWQPGVSANPGGRPLKTPVTTAMRELLREMHPNQKKYPGRTRAQVQALQILAQAEKGDLASQKEMLDRTEGKVSQSVQVGGDPNNPTPIVFDQMTPEEKQIKLTALLARQQSGGKDGKPERD